MPPSPEIPQIEILRQSLSRLVQEIQVSLLREHNLDPEKFLDVSQSILTGYTEDQLRHILDEMGAGQVDEVGPAMTFITPLVPGEEVLGQALWLDDQNPDIAGLANLTESNFDQHLQGLLMVIEEVSHILYIQSYYKQYRTGPPNWLQEMTAALDKYMVIQEKYFRKYHRLMQPEEQQRIISDIFRAVNNPYPPEEHRVGQEHAYRAMQHLNNLAQTGRQAEANSLEAKLFSSIESDLRRLFSE